MSSRVIYKQKRKVNYSSLFLNVILPKHHFFWYTICMKKYNQKLKMAKRVLLFLVGVFLLTIVAFFLYVSDYYKADNLALSIMNENTAISVEDNLTILSPSLPSDTAFIFYPGAKVEHTAYLPILQKLQRKGITCILVKMPFNMAIFDADGAEPIFNKFPEIKNWYIGGHSMGGAMASGFASKNQEKVKGLILLGAYIYGSYPPEKALTIYGTLNSDLEKNIDYTKNIVKIEGGNHAQFGNYGEQKGDLPATISQEQQQEMAVEAILEFVIR